MNLTNKWWNPNQQGNKMKDRSKSDSQKKQKKNPWPVFYDTKRTLGIRPKTQIDASKRTKGMG